MAIVLVLRSAGMVMRQRPALALLNAATGDYPSSGGPSKGC